MSEKMSEGLLALRAGIADPYVEFQATRHGMPKDEWLVVLTVNEAGSVLADVEAMQKAVRAGAAYLNAQDAVMQRLNDPTAPYSEQGLDMDKLYNEFRTATLEAAKLLPEEESDG